MRSENHSRRAEPALQAVLVPKRFLEGMKSVFWGQPFNRRYCRSVRLNRKAGTRFDSDAINKHSTRAALTRIASNFCSSDSAQITNEMHEQLSRFDLALILATVHR